MNHDIMLAHASSNAASLCACVHVAHKENSLTTCANTLLNWELRSLPSQKLRFFFRIVGTIRKCTNKRLEEWNVCFLKYEVVLPYLLVNLWYSIGRVN